MKAALYLRLSDDDKEIGESKSITYQRKILTEYCEKNNIAIYKDYVDDGYSGKNLLRPSFKKMMEDAKKNYFNIIIVKDLSRLARRLADVQDLIEERFKELNIRFISLFNNFDTANSYDQQYILQAYADEYYRRDISRKIRKVFQVKADNGILKTILPYGYKRIDDMVIIDKEAEPVIREIFDRILHGESTADIAEDFNKRKIPTCKYEMGLSKRKTIWTPGTIRKILNNDFYLGKREVLKSSKSPLTYYHPAYFDFDYISNVRSKLVKKPRKDIDNLRLGKMIYYGNSKNAMVYKETKYTKKYVDHVSTFKIETSLLHELIFSEVREFIKLIKANQNQFKEISLKYYKENKLSATRMECEQEIKKLEKKSAHICEQFLEGNLMEEKYIEENSRYTKEIHELKQKINELELSDIDLQQFNEKINFYKEELLKCRTFNLDLIRKLINKIIIHQDYGRLTIEILYKCYF